MGLFLSMKNLKCWRFRMCIIIDTNCLASVFDRKAEKHNQFAPVLEWIISGKGKLIYGGSKYLEELKKSRKYLRIINLLKSKGKAVLINKVLVDAEQKRIEKEITDDDFDDPHLPAIVIVSKCKIICSVDSRSIKFVTQSRLYPKGIDVPKYYTNIRNKDLLCDRNIHDCYKPLTKCTKKDKEQINKVLV